MMETTMILMGVLPNVKLRIFTLVTIRARPVPVYVSTKEYQSMLVSNTWREMGIKIKELSFSHYYLPYYFSIR